MPRKCVCTQKKKNMHLFICLQTLCYITFLIKEWLLMFTSLEGPCISWPSEQHLKLIEARFAAFMLHWKTHLGLFHNQEQHEFCHMMLGDACAPGSRPELQHRRGLLSKKHCPGHGMKEQMRGCCYRKTRNASIR